ncbi:hypothetical protein HK407_05g08860 [Ordospora pajunii]|jgi:hypothetical protein|uniref:uncharacterized protein n=1 Tax=Ordospora pajunii TaxID=3039483 RepID=UPI0029528B63|nr:uncharacterized protein HK407_05g08860 [Ordospora pajunii]KAH9411510.1 hypothetical protein HK407_05g08860 [Ordospora pajunii]
MAKISDLEDPSMADEVISKMKVSCSIGARRMLSVCMIVSAGFFLCCIDEFSKEYGGDEEALIKILSAIGIECISNA